MNKRCFVSLGIMLVLCVAVYARATVAIFWRSDEGMSEYIYKNDGVTKLSVNSIVQLIWSSSNVPFTPVTPANWNTPPADHVILDSKPTTSAGNWDFETAFHDATNYGFGEDYFVGGYAYQRAFDVAWGSSPGINDYYGDSRASVIAGPLADQDPTPTTPDYSFLNDSGLYTTSLQIVPEPGTIALLGMGLLTVAFRRRKPRNQT